jgi:hypothetical protein
MEGGWNQPDHGVTPTNPLEKKYGPSSWKTIAYCLPTTRAIIQSTFKVKNILESLWKPFFNFIFKCWSWSELPHSTGPIRFVSEGCVSRVIFKHRQRSLTQN